MSLITRRLAVGLAISATAAAAIIPATASAARTNTQKDNAITFSLNVSAQAGFRALVQDRRIAVFEDYTKLISPYLNRLQQYQVNGAELTPLSSDWTYRSTFGDAGLQNTTPLNDSGNPGYATTLHLPSNSKVSKVRFDFQDPNAAGADDDGQMQFFVTQYDLAGVATQLLPAGTTAGSSGVTSNNQGKNAVEFTLPAPFTVTDNFRYVLRVNFTNERIGQNTADATGNRFFGATFTYNDQSPAVPALIPYTGKQQTFKTP